MKKIKLIKNCCEIDECKETEFLHLHHIVERSEINTSNHNFNLAILCPLHHSYVHHGKLKIIGVFPSTKLPNARTLVYELNGVKNLDIDIPYVTFEAKSYKLRNKNEF